MTTMITNEAAERLHASVEQRIAELEQRIASRD